MKEKRKNVYILLCQTDKVKRIQLRKIREKKGMTVKWRMREERGGER